VHAKIATRLTNDDDSDMPQNDTNVQRTSIVLRNQNMADSQKRQIFKKTRTRD